jgi:hypothetical protein
MGVIAGIWRTRVVGRNVAAWFFGELKRVGERARVVLEFPDGEIRGPGRQTGPKEPRWRSSSPSVPTNDALAFLGR